MATIKDFIKKIGNEAISLEEQQLALEKVEKAIIEAKAKRSESISKNVDLVVSTLKETQSKVKSFEAQIKDKLTELDNTPARQGVQGPVGKAGKDGKDGKDGKEGPVGRTGKDGIDGKDGKDGEDGVSVVDAQVHFDGSLVVYLSNGNEIDCGQILSPDVAQNIIINSGGSGTSQAITDAINNLVLPINPTFTYTSGVLSSIAYGSGESKVFTYTDGVLTQLDFTRAGVTIRKTFNYTSGVLTSITQETL